MYKLVLTNMTQKLFSTAAVLGAPRFLYPKATECKGYFNTTGSRYQASGVCAFQSGTSLRWVHNDDLATNLMRVIDVERFYPLILMFFAFVMTFYYECFMKVYASANAKTVLNEKKALISSAMSTALNWKVSAKKIRQEKLDKIHTQLKNNKEKEKYEVDPDNELKKATHKYSTNWTCKFRHH